MRRRSGPVTNLPKKAFGWSRQRSQRLAWRASRGKRVAWPSCYSTAFRSRLWQERNSLVVTGQLLDVSHPQVIGRDVQLTLSNCGASIVNTVTNQFGEFQGEVENSGDLQLSFLGRAGKPVVILLRGVLDPLS